MTANAVASQHRLEQSAKTGHQWHGVAISGITDDEREGFSVGHFGGLRSMCERLRLERH